MGRPPKSVEDKRQIVTLRLDGATRSRIEEMAGQSGRSLAAELEARVRSTLDLDAVGLRLVALIGAELQAVAKLADEPDWHSTLLGWSIAKEMLARGPIAYFRPESAFTDPEANEAWVALEAKNNERRDVLRRLSALGIELPENANQANRGLLGMAMLDSRALARQQLEALPESSERDTALDLLADLVRIDAEVTIARAEWVEHLRLYANEERKGRDLYRARLRENARRHLAAGEKYIPEHLHGEFGDGS